MRSAMFGLVAAIATATQAAALPMGGMHATYDAVVDHFGADLLGLWALHPDHVFADVAGTVAAAPDSALGRVKNYLDGGPDLVAGLSNRLPAARALGGPMPGVDYVGWQSDSATSPQTGRWLQTEADIGVSGATASVVLDAFILPIPFEPAVPQQVLWYVMEEGDPLRGDGSFGVVRSRGAADQLMSRIRLDDGTNASRRGLHQGDIDGFEPTIWEVRAGGDPASPSTDREVSALQQDGLGGFAALPFTELETNPGPATLTDGRLVLGSTSSGNNAADGFFTGAIIALNRLTVSDFERQLLIDAAAPVPWLIEEPAPGATVPLPAPLALLAGGLTALFALRRRRRGAPA